MTRLRIGEHNCDPVWACARDMDGLRLMLNERRVSLKMTMLDLDARTGLADGYSAKLLCGDKGFGQLSLSLILQALKCQLMLVPEGAEPAGASSENSFSFKPIKDCALAERRTHWARLGALGEGAWRRLQSGKRWPREGGRRHPPSVPRSGNTCGTSAISGVRRDALINIMIHIYRRHHVRITNNKSRLNGEC
jgi:hypothetical protein